MGLGRKEPTHSAAMVGISSLDTGKQSRQSVEIQPQSSRQGRSWSSILDRPAGVPGMGWGALALQNDGLVTGPQQGPHLCECLHCAEGKLWVPLALAVVLTHGQTCAQQCPSPGDPGDEVLG